MVSRYHFRSWVPGVVVANQQSYEERACGHKLAEGGKGSPAPQKINAWKPLTSPPISVELQSIRSITEASPTRE